MTGRAACSALLPAIDESSTHFICLFILTLAWWFYFSVCVRCVAVSHRDFNVHFPDDSWRWATFHRLTGHPLLGEVSVQMSKYFPCLIGLDIVSLLNCQSNLYILDTRLLYFANIFSQSRVCLFIFLTVSFAKHKFLMVNKSNLYSFLTVCVCVCVSCLFFLLVPRQWPLCSRYILA